MAMVKEAALNHEATHLSGGKLDICPRVVASGYASLTGVYPATRGRFIMEKEELRKLLDETMGEYIRKAAKKYITLWVIIWVMFAALLLTNIIMIAVLNSRLVG